MKPKREYLILTSIFIIAIIARVAKFDDIDLVLDTVAYSRLGKNLIEFGRYAFGENYNMGVFFPPGYPIMIGLIDKIFNDLFFSAKFVSFLLSCFSIFFAYLLGRELYDKEAGLFASFLFAVYPAVLIVSVQGYSDAPFFCFLLLTVYLFLKTLKNDRLIIYIFIGLLTGITYLIRPEGLFLLLLPILQTFNLSKGRISLNKRHLFRLLIVIVIFIVIISPYALFVKGYTGRLNLSGKANISILLSRLSGDYNYHQIVNAPDNLYDRVAFRLTDNKTQLWGWNRNKNLSLFEYIFDDPVEFLKKYQKNILQEIYTLIKLLFPFMIPLFFSFFYRDLFVNKKRLIFLFLPFIFFFIYPIFIIIEKQTLLIAVFLMIFSSGGFSRAKEIVKGLADYYGVKTGMNLMDKLIKPFIIIILILSSLSYIKYSRFQHFDPLHAKPEEHEKAGYYLKKRFKPQYEEFNIMGNRPYVSFYSGSRFTMLPYAPVEDVIYFGRFYKVHFIVVDERTIGGWDYYKELWNMDKVRDDVELIYEDNTEKPIRIFRINY
ncbi:MAG: glycosyltransferase family 39 protein [Candidatus Nitrosocaldus sp.]